MPACSQNASVGPLIARPPTNGLTATTGAGAARNASRIPGSERIGPIEITGLDGPITIASASAIAWSTASEGGARSSPRSSTLSTGPSPRSRIMNSWNGSLRPRAPTQVDTRSSLIGSTCAPTPIASTTARCASVRLCPARSSSVRTRHIARSRSPSRNQCGRPARSRASMTFQVSSRRPQPRSSI